MIIESDEEDDEEDREEDEEGLPSALKGDRNSQLTVGYKGDRSYVVRGNNIGVFNHSNDVGVKYYATISKIATPKGKEFKPQNVNIHETYWLKNNSRRFPGYASRSRHKDDIDESRRAEFPLQYGH